VHRENKVYQVIPSKGRTFSAAGVEYQESGYQGNRRTGREIKNQKWIPAFAGMTKEEAAVKLRAKYRMSGLAIPLGRTRKDEVERCGTSHGLPGEMAGIVAVEQAYSTHCNYGDYL